MTKNALIFWSGIPGVLQRHSEDHEPQEANKALLQKINEALILDLARELSNCDEYDSFFFYEPFLHDGIYNFRDFNHVYQLNFKEYHLQDGEEKALESVLKVKKYARAVLVYPCTFELDHMKVLKSLKQLLQTESVFWPLINQKLALLGMRDLLKIWPLKKDSLSDLKQKAKQQGWYYAFMKPDLQQLDTIKHVQELWQKMISKDFKLCSEYQYLKNTYQTMKKYHDQLNINLK